MLRVPLFILLVALIQTMPVAGAEWVALTYHDVRDDVRGDLDPDRFAVSTEHLAQHFEWLRENGWTPIGIDDLIAAREGRRPLPERAVLLTFDDGLASVYTKVFPLLKLFDYPAVVALVGRWLELEEGETVSYGGREVGRKHFVDTAQLREMVDSKLVEIASHSYDLHHGIRANPQGNQLPAGYYRRYDPEERRYESDAAYEARIRRDLARNSALLERLTGRRPRVIVWPFGEYNERTEAIAAELGMPVSLGLTTGVNDLESLRGLNRFLISENPGLESFVWHLPQRPDSTPVRVAQVDLDFVYDPDPEQQKRNLDRLLDRIKALDINTVYLQAFADPDGDGNAAALYFPNRHLPVRADLFSRVAWQLRTRAEVEVFAWMPMLAFVLPDEAQNRALAVERWLPGGGRAAVTGTDYRRLSPFKPEARRIIGEIYEDLARHTPLQGILFHDDARLGEHEGAAAAQSDARHFTGRAVDAARPLAPREKTMALVAFGEELFQRVQRWRSNIKSARNLYAEVVLEPRSEAGFAQSLPVFLERYDQVALMAMPWLEQAEEPEAWLEMLVRSVDAYPGGLEGTVFELQSRDWRDGRWLPSELLRRQMRELQRRHAIHFGYYPDDFIGGHPSLRPLHSAISLRTHPYPEP